MGSAAAFAGRCSTKARVIGYVAHRTIVPMECVPAGVLREEVVLWGGPGYHIVHYPLRHGTVFNIVAVFRTSTFAEKGDAQGHAQELERTYRDAHPPMKAVLELMDLEGRRAVPHRDPLRHLPKGRAMPRAA